MRDNFTIVLNESDFNELQRRLSFLADTDKRAAIGKALQSGIRVILNRGKENFASTDLHTGTGKNLKKSFAIKLDRKKSVSYAGFKRPKGAAAHLVDRGTKPRYTRNGYYRGTVQKGGPYTGSRFWTSAVESEGPRAVETLMDTIYDEITKIMLRG